MSLKRIACYAIYVLAITIFIPSFMAEASASAEPVAVWAKTYGGPLNDASNSISIARDGYVMAGYTESFGNGSSDVYVVKVDRNGNLVYNKTFGGPGDDSAYSISPTGDGGYIIGGYTFSFSNDSQMYLIKIGANGTEEWEKTYGGVQNDYGRSAIQTSDGGYAILGYSYSFGEEGFADVFLVKTDREGNEQWNRTYGGKFSDEGRMLIQASDGGFTIIGYTKSIGQGLEDVYLIKTDGNGIEQWNRTYGGPQYDDGYAIQETEDGYAIAGTTKSFGKGKADVYLIKTDKNGTEQWNKTYGGLEDDGGFSLVKAADGYLIGATTYSPGDGEYDAFVIKTDGRGNEEWNQVYGGQGSEYLYTVLADDSILLAGYTTSSGSGGRDAFLIKLGDNGAENTPVLSPACESLFIIPVLGILAILSNRKK